MHDRSGQHLILGGDFSASLHGLTDFHHVEESIPRPTTVTDTKDFLCARALHTLVAEMDLAVTNTWMDNKNQLDGTKDAQTQMDFIMR